MPVIGLHVRSLTRYLCVIFALSCPRTPAVEGPKAAAAQRDDAAQGSIEACPRQMKAGTTNLPRITPSPAVDHALGAREPRCWLGDCPRRAAADTVLRT